MDILRILRIFDKNKRFMIYYFLKRWIIVGNETDLIRGLVYALRDADGLKEQLKLFNGNISVFANIAYELKRANDLKEIELGITHEDNKTLYRYDYSQGKGRK